MINSKITKHSANRILILLSLMLMITACNSGGTANSTTDDKYIESADESLEQPDIPGSSNPDSTPVASLSWVAPSERENNKPMSLSEIAGYKIYYGTSTNTYNDHIVIDHGSTDNYTFNDLAAGTYYFAITTFDTAGRESQYSAETIIIIDV